MLVATVVLQLVSEHRLGLTDPVDRWLPGLLPAGNGVTVRELLDHTSGLFDHTHTLPLSPPTAYLPLRWTTWTPRQLVARATAQPPTFPPGTDYEYSSTGYMVLGMLIQRVTAARTVRRSLGGSFGRWVCGGRRLRAPTLASTVRARTPICRTAPVASSTSPSSTRRPTAGGWPPWPGVADRSHPVKASEVCRHTAMPFSTVHRLILTISEENFTLPLGLVTLQGNWAPVASPPCWPAWCCR
jgi:hypothetical protein